MDVSKNKKKPFNKSEEIKVIKTKRDGENC